MPGPECELAWWTLVPLILIWLLQTLICHPVLHSLIWNAVSPCRLCIEAASFLISPVPLCKTQLFLTLLQCWQCPLQLLMANIPRLAPSCLVVEWLSVIWRFILLFVFILTLPFNSNLVISRLCWKLNGSSFFLRYRPNSYLSLQAVQDPALLSLHSMWRDVLYSSHFTHLDIFFLSKMSLDVSNYKDTNVRLVCLSFPPFPIYTGYPIIPKDLKSVNIS